MSSSPVDRLWNLKHEAAKHGVIAPEKTKGFKFLVGRDFVAALLMEPSLRWSSRASLKGDINKVFGVPIEESSKVPPNGLRLVFELDG